jgi:hypothetical protein
MDDLMSIIIRVTYDCHNSLLEVNELLISVLKEKFIKGPVRFGAKSIQVFKTNHVKNKPVFGNRGSESLCHWNWPSCEGDWVVEKNSRKVEEKMAQSDLK